MTPGSFFQSGTPSRFDEKSPGKLVIAEPTK